jgi:uncharacterized membrane protein HdeD (DUF308 family)
MNANPVNEFSELRASWWWFLLLGILLAVCGTAAIIFPALTVTTSLVTVVFLGVLLMVAGIATVIGAFSAGKWSGLLLHLLAGMFYVLTGFLITEAPLAATAWLTLLLAGLFIVLGVFRIVVALMVRFPSWGWSLLNGVVTLLAGMVIYRHFPQSALWVVGLLVGLEMLFSGWTWLMLAACIRNSRVETN